MNACCASIPQVWNQAHQKAWIQSCLFCGGEKNRLQQRTKITIRT